MAVFDCDADGADRRTEKRADRKVSGNFAILLFGNRNNGTLMWLSCAYYNPTTRDQDTARCKLLIIHLIVKFN